MTRGIVVVALTDKAIRHHNEQIRAGNWDKLYLARTHVSGDRRADDLVGMYKVHLRRVGGRAKVVRSGGKRSLTEILSLHPAPQGDGQFHVLIRLITGRFHQIRATTAHLGAPLVGDRLYGQGASESRPFYLEHIALRFTPFGADTSRVIHWRDDPDREEIAQQLRAELDTLLASWRGSGSP